jgi:hypothetical protein
MVGERVHPRSALYRSIYLLVSSVFLCGLPSGYRLSTDLKALKSYSFADPRPRGPLYFNQATESATHRTVPLL